MLPSSSDTQTFVCTPPIALLADMATLVSIGAVLSIVTVLPSVVVLDVPPKSPIPKNSMVNSIAPSASSSITANWALKLSPPVPAGASLMIETRNGLMAEPPTANDTVGVLAVSWISLEAVKCTVTVSPATAQLSETLLDETMRVSVSVSNV